jgi:hypothetical protein
VEVGGGAVGLPVPPGVADGDAVVEQPAANTRTSAVAAARGSRVDRGGRAEAARISVVIAAMTTTSPDWFPAASARPFAVRSRTGTHGAARDGQRGA